MRDSEDMNGGENCAAPLVSVIVLAYNAEATIDATMSALVDQNTDFRFEIVVGDDDSSDATRAKAEAWEERFPETVRLMPKMPNKGVVRNYFDCLVACAGKYVTDCSAGDLFTTDTRLQTMADYLETHDDVLAVFTDAEGNEYTGNDTVEHFLAPHMYGTLILSAVMYRRETILKLLKENGDMVLNERFACEDLGVLCALLAAGRVVKVNSPSFRYDVAPGSISHDSDVRREMRFAVDTLKARVALARHYGALTKDVKANLRIKLNHVADIAFFRRDKQIRAMWREAFGAMKGMRGFKAWVKKIMMLDF